MVTLHSAATERLKGIILFPCCHREKVLVYELSRGRTSNKCPRCGEYAIFDYDHMTAERATAKRSITLNQELNTHID